MRLLIFGGLIALLFSCSVFKKVNRTKIETEAKTEIDSTATVHNDITMDSKTETTTKEEIDTAVFISPEGHLIERTEDVKKESIKVPVKKTKETKTNSDSREVDKSKIKTDLKKLEEKKEEVKVMDKEVKRSGIPWFWWLILAVIAAWFVAYRFGKLFTR